MSRFSGLCDASLSSHLKLNCTKVSRNLQDEGLEVRFAKFSRRLIGASKRFCESDTCIKGSNGLNFKLFGQNFSRPILFLLDRLKPVQDT